MEPIQGTNIQITLSDDKDILDFRANIPPKDVALTLCTQGEARIRINEKDCVWRRNEILVSYCMETERNLGFLSRHSYREPATRYKLRVFQHCFPNLFYQQASFAQVEQLG